jgi:hypothetical protein
MRTQTRQPAGRLRRGVAIKRVQARRLASLTPLRITSMLSGPEAADTLDKEQERNFLPAFSLIRAI